MASFNGDVNANAIALYLLVILIAGSVWFLVWVFSHLARETQRKRR